ncbi:DNA recombination protein RmuC [Polymorphobacter sp. PAMC 29334]|uniref:DNA recombination protein RmuC n=1 Tax=Polymorphobacter sp. PAMC 29334 TaxID=2862331 RepID=UPI001C66842F|nr:DNA recombination protein RmuC [Polymorphobacter sp. PAMC 29334]QYE36069.1 DNA recombination protein RmuC [Polymorphobacter sp. PAMC 29334]
MEVAVAVLVVALVVLAAAWFAWGRNLAAARAQVVDHRIAIGRHAVEVEAQQVRLAELSGVEAERNRLAADLAGLRAGQAERDVGHARQLADLQTSFAALAAKALDGAQTAFLERAEARFAEHKTLSETGMAALLAPVAETLTRYEGELKKVEVARAEAYGGLREQVTALALGNARVSDEASKLVSALRSSGKTSGSWGEQQLRNVLDMAGLREGIDFTLQTSTDRGDGNKRPDAIINLPGGRQLIVDSKCSLNDYLSAGEADSEDGRRAAYKRHAAAVRTHARGLGDKNYWKDFGASADFVVMFLPGENFLSAALEHDLPLLGWAFDQRILLAGPINLLAIAKTVALVWRQETQAEQWREIGALGAQLHAAVATMTEHLSSVGKNLTQAVNAYNGFVGSLEANVLPKARRFTDLGVDPGKKGIAPLAPIDGTPRIAAAPELLPPPAAIAAE